MLNHFHVALLLPPSFEWLTRPWLVGRLSQYLRIRGAAPQSLRDHSTLARRRSKRRRLGQFFFINLPVIVKSPPAVLALDSRKTRTIGLSSV